MSSMDPKYQRSDISPYGYYRRVPKSTPEAREKAKQPGYAPVQPIRDVQVLVKIGSHPKTVTLDANNIKFIKNDDGTLRIDNRQFQTFDSTKSHRWKPGESGNPGGLPAAKTNSPGTKLATINRIFFSPLLKHEAFAKYFNPTTGEPYPHAWVDLALAINQTIFTKPEMLDLVYKKLQEEYIKDPLTTMERMMKLFGPNSIQVFANNVSIGDASNAIAHDASEDRKLNIIKIIENKPDSGSWDGTAAPSDSHN